MNITGLETCSIRNHPQRARILRILQTALQAVDPSNVVRWHLHREGQFLFIDETEIENNLRLDLEQFQRIRLVAFGKAAIPMANAAVEILGNYLTDGIVITKEGYLDDLNTKASIANLLAKDSRIRILEAGHPVPNERSLQAGEETRSFLSDGQPNDLILVLISGGGSALLVLPAPGITLTEIQKITSLLLACGANIQEINSLRKHLDLIKGGGLVRLASPAQIISLILSDVVGDPLDVIASGPTVPDPTTFADGWQVLETIVLPYLQGDAGKDIAPPESIIERLSRGCSRKIAETPKPGDQLFDRVSNLLVGSNIQAASAALRQAQAEGLNTLLLTTLLQGEARQAGKFFSSILRQIDASGQPLARPACLIAGGETTVTLNLSDPQFENSLGGRNQELALGAVSDLDGLRDVFLISLATDGGDGPTDAAGAVVTGETMRRARALGLDPEACLRKHDSYHFFQELDDLLKPGPTQTNVNDLTFLFAL